MNLCRWVKRMLGELGRLVGKVTAVGGPGERIDLEAINLDFEGAFSHYLDAPELYIAEGWIPWWHWQDRRPEFKRATRQDAPGNRVKEGKYAQQWFNTFSKSISGIYQQVGGITPGIELVLKGWVMAWTCGENEGLSKSTGRLYMRIGIDPYGGIDPDSSDIVWSGEGHAVQPYDAYELLEVRAIAKSDRATVFVWSYSEWEMANNNAYVDGLEFYGLGMGPEPEPLPEEWVQEIAREEIRRTCQEIAVKTEVIRVGLEGLLQFLQSTQDALPPEEWTPVDDVIKGR